VIVRHQVKCVLAIPSSPCVLAGTFKDFRVFIIIQQSEMLRPVSLKKNLEVYLSDRLTIKTSVMCSCD
jgi:hypothetical protein